MSEYRTFTSTADPGQPQQETLAQGSDTNVLQTKKGIALGHHLGALWTQQTMGSNLQNAGQYPPRYPGVPDVYYVDGSNEPSTYWDSAHYSSRWQDPNYLKAHRYGTYGAGLKTDSSGHYVISYGGNPVPAPGYLQQAQQWWAQLALEVANATGLSQTEVETIAELAIGVGVAYTVYRVTR